MRVVRLEERPFYELAYKCAAPGGGRSEPRTLPLIRGTVDRLPAALDALVIASDLQGMARCPEREGVIVLLGEALARELSRISKEGDIPAHEKVGIILAGDLYSDPNAKKRGASGDVRVVWEAFGDRFRWVAGVAGNHDEFGDEAAHAQFKARAGISLLDGEARDLDGLKVGGVSGIMGRSQKLGRKPPEEFMFAVQHVLSMDPEVLVLHEGPNGPDPDQLGNEMLRSMFEPRTEPFVVCGHSHWKTPLASFTGGIQVANVDSRVLVLVRA